MMASTLISEYEAARRDVETARSRVQEAAAMLAARTAEMGQIERRLAAALHYHGRPVCYGSVLYRLGGIGDAARIVRTDVSYAHDTIVPDLPPELDDDPEPSPRGSTQWLVWADRQHIPLTRDDAVAALDGQQVS